METKKFNSDMEQCPECGANWFEGVRESDGTRCKSLIGLYDRDRDMTVQWQCPACGATWDRFTNELVIPGKPKEEIMDAQVETAALKVKNPKMVEAGRRGGLARAAKMASKVASKAASKRLEKVRKAFGKSIVLGTKYRDPEVQKQLTEALVANPALLQAAQIIRDAMKEKEAEVVRLRKALRSLVGVDGDVDYPETIGPGEKPKKTFTAMGYSIGVPDDSGHMGQRRDAKPRRGDLPVLLTSILKLHGRAMTVKDIHHAVVQRGRTVTPAGVYYILRTHEDKFTKLRRGVYTINNHPDLD